MEKAFIILGNQLFNTKFFEQYKDHKFFMAEDFGLCTYEKHHKHKIIFFLSSMRSFKEELENLKFDIFYHSCHEKDFKKSYEEKLQNFITSKRISSISFFEIEDKNFELRIFRILKKLDVKFSCIRTPMFLSKREDFKNYLNKNKKPFMASFYKIQRKKNNILVSNDGSPIGGKWSFDTENRKKIPNSLDLPSQPQFKDSKHTIEIKEFVKKNFENHPGSVQDFWIGTTRDDAWACFEHFIKYKIELFGDFEDAVSHKDNVLFHSALSPFINIGLITPGEIISRLSLNESKIRINSYEGFIRQIIGWREFMRGIYQNFEKELGTSNFFSHNRIMKKSWYEGKTGLEPLDFSIKNALKYGWTHHIERLMILANIMNLCEIRPIEVYKWFMEMFIDSSEWVMYPNVYGMGLFSDGGIFATKPYICGSAYFLKMMDFKKGNWCRIMDGLYWRFIEKNKIFFQKNPRLSMMVRILDKMKVDRKEEIFASAGNFIKLNTK